MKLLVFAIVVIVNLIPTRIYASEFWDELGKAKLALQEKDYAKTYLQLDVARKLAGENQLKLAAIENAYGWTLFLQGDTDNSKEIIKKAVARLKSIPSNPQHALSSNTPEDLSNAASVKRKAQNNLALIALLTGDPNEASDASRSSAANSSEGKALYNLAESEKKRAAVNALLDQGKAMRDGSEAGFKKAIVEYDKALKIDPSNSIALDYKSHAFLRLGQYTDAIAASTKAIESDPSRATSVLNLIKAQCANSRAADALDSASKHSYALNRQYEAVILDKELNKYCGNPVANQIAELAKRKR